MVECLYKWQDSPNEILVYTDSDWAGCQRTRRSTTGGAVMYGSCLVAHWSRTQVSLALSSAEAELNAAVKAACEAIGMKQLCGHLGRPVTIKMFGDSSATKGTLSRKGSGKVQTLRDTTALASGAHSLRKRGSSQSSSRLESGRCSYPFLVQGGWYQALLQYESSSN